MVNASCSVHDPVPLKVIALAQVLPAQVIVLASDAVNVIAPVYVRVNKVAGNVKLPLIVHAAVPANVIV